MHQHSFNVPAPALPSLLRVCINSTIWLLVPVVFLQLSPQTSAVVVFGHIYGNFTSPQTSAVVVFGHVYGNFTIGVVHVVHTCTTEHPLVTCAEGGVQSMSFSPWSLHLFTGSASLVSSVNLSSSGPLELLAFCRATSQWFASVAGFKEAALEAIKGVSGGTVKSLASCSFRWRPLKG